MKLYRFTFLCGEVSFKGVEVKECPLSYKVLDPNCFTSSVLKRDIDKIPSRYMPNYPMWSLEKNRKKYAEKLLEIKKGEAMDLKVRLGEKKREIKILEDIKWSC